MSEVLRGWITEGKVRKGGVNNPPMADRRPSPPGGSRGNKKVKNRKDQT